MFGTGTNSYILTLTEKEVGDAYRLAQAKRLVAIWEQTKGKKKAFGAALKKNRNDEEKIVPTDDDIVSATTAILAKRYSRS